MNIDLSHVAQDVRRDILTMSYTAQSAHTGGALSVVEILVALYFSVMHIPDPKKTEDPVRDRLVFSKAHDAKALYSVLARRGFFDPILLAGYEKNEGMLPGHSTRNCVPGVEVSAGSLGHGLSMAAGMAWAIMMHESGRMNHRKKHNSSFIIRNSTPRVFAVLSDGECDEGSVWEAALFAGHHGIHNLTVIVDYNTLQGYGKNSEVLELEPFADKWKAFGFDTLEVDGHSFPELIAALTSVHTKPLVILAHTVKGNGGPPQHINQISSQYKPPTEGEYLQLVNRKP